MKNRQKHLKSASACLYLPAVIIKLFTAHYDKPFLKTAVVQLLQVLCRSHAGKRLELAYQVGLVVKPGF